ncbi:hypothetical protein HNO88_001294 [Novosphingobium chloroacetimidivorans]|uniref:Uncharacterized protein n=1 Tax=Novosphingobium chloroacetimidivorans TaxID=1428314 RepID=A0A7W7K851_9SPHN|nr:hypothetical protein [Novosphingobium chloroacetimidivorans]
MRQRNPDYARMRSGRLSLRRIGAASSIQNACWTSQAGEAQVGVMVSEACLDVLMRPQGGKVTLDLLGWTVVSWQ